MAINFVTAVVKTERRLRLFFDNTLAAGAFVTSFYTVENIDGVGPDPDVVSALIVSGAPNAVELALSENFAPKGLYKLDVASGVPATDFSTAPAASYEFRTAGQRLAPSEEIDANEVDREFFGEDIVWDGRDWAEDAEGDIAAISGVENARQAVIRRLEGSPLQWDETYSPRAREFVDGPPTVLGDLRGLMVAQALEDDRVEQADAKVLGLDADNKPQRTIRTTIVFVGGSRESIDSLVPESGGSGA